MAHLIGTIKKVATEIYNEYPRFDYGLQTNMFINKYAGPIQLVNLISNLPVYTSKRLRTAAGKAFYRNEKLGACIILHPACVDTEDEIFKTGHGTNTFFHEIAHHVAYFAAKERGHSFAWAYSLMQFGYTPSRCYDSTKVDYRNHKQRAEKREIEEIVSLIPDLGI